MSKLLSFILFISLLASIVPGSIQAAPSVPAFPGAEGWGAQSVGGRGGKVIEVTNLNDAGPGSLRACAQETSGPRICVFRVAGIIDLTSDALRVWHPYLTIAGQTAPGGGITLRGDRIIISTHNVIIRYVRWRGGGFSFVTLRPWNNFHDVIIDHCTASGGQDDTFDVWFGGPQPSSVPDMTNITIQNCLIAEAHAVHPTGMVFGGTPDLSRDPPDYLRIHHISVHHNYFAHNGWRNPLVGSQHTEVINNVVYNWSNRIGGTYLSSEADFINNYWKTGPMSVNALVFEWLTEAGVPLPLSSHYIAGNIIPTTPSQYWRVDKYVPSFGLTDPNQDNWFLFMTNQSNFGDYGNPVPETNRRFTPLTPAPYPVTITPALSVFNSVVTNAGANARLTSNGTLVNNSDEADQKLINDFSKGTGPTSPPTSVTMPSSIDPGTPYTDSDKDGMADEWENIHFGSLAQGSASDSSSDNDGDGYTDLEEFLNGTNPGNEENIVSPVSQSSPTPTPSPTLPPVSTGEEESSEGGGGSLAAIVLFIIVLLLGFFAWKKFRRKKQAM